jgi:thymidylate synthase
MRSNDATKGLTHDIFCFTMLQEIVAKRLQLDLGYYTHMVGSLHYYLTDDEGKATSDEQKVIDFLAEGFQSSRHMPPMPTDDPRFALERVLDAEKSLRTSGSLGLADGPTDPYWQDIVRLLQAFRFQKDQQYQDLDQMRTQMHSKVYDVYLMNQSSR